MRCVILSRCSVGDTLYTTCRLMLEGARLASNCHSPYVHLAVDEIPIIRDPRLSPRPLNVRTQWTRARLIEDMLVCASDIPAGLSRARGDLMQRILPVLLDMRNGRRTPYCVVTFCAFTYAMGWFDPQFVLFNSHDCNSNGFPLTAAIRGRAALITSPDARDIANHIACTLLPFIRTGPCLWVFLEFDLDVGRLEPARRTTTSSASAPAPIDPISCESPHLLEPPDPGGTAGPACQLPVPLDEYSRAERSARVAPRLGTQNFHQHQAQAQAQDLHC